MRILIAGIFVLALGISALAQSGTDRDFAYFFYGKAELADRKVIPVSELRACMLGDNLRPSVRGKFKSEVTATALNQTRRMEAGECDVALVFDDRPDGLERVKRDHPGFALYRIAGDDLELVSAPAADGWIAVGRMALAAQTKLEKSQLTGCGDGPLRELFRPNPRVWMDWRPAQVKFEELNTAKQLDTANVLLFGCDVWILSPADYARFSKKYGTKYPLFNVSADDPVLTRKQ